MSLWSLHYQRQQLLGFDLVSAGRWRTTSRGLRGDVWTSGTGACVCVCGRSLTLLPTKSVLVITILCTFCLKCSSSMSLSWLLKQQFLDLADLIITFFTKTKIKREQSTWMYQATIFLPVCEISASCNKNSILYDFFIETLYPTVPMPEIMWTHGLAQVQGNVNAKGSSGENTTSVEKT